LLDLKAGAERRVLITYKQQPTCVAFSPNGKLVASASYDGSARVHRTDTGKEVFQLQAKKVIYSQCFAPGGKALLAGGEHAVSFWDTQTGQRQRGIDGVAGQLWTIQFAPDGKTFAGGTSEGVIHIWETASARQLQRIKAHADNVQAVAYTPDG